MADVTSKVATIRNAVYGNEVREGIASGIENINTEVISTTGRQTTLEGTQGILQSQFSDVVTNATATDPSSVEIVAARLGEVDLPTKIGQIDSSLADIVTLAKDVNTLQSKIDSTINKMLIPVGNYNLTDTLILKNGINIEGAIPNEVAGEQTTKIIVNGMDAFNAPSSTRIRFNMRNIHIVGTGIENGINFPFGGRIENCYFENLNIGINNPVGYLVQYINCQFNNCNIGINTDIVNSTIVDTGYFNDCRVGANFGNDSATLSVINTCINMGTNFEKGIVANGDLTVENSYFEGFGVPNANSVCIEYTASTFATKSLKIQKCNMNGHGVVKNGISLGLGTGQTNGYIAGDISLNNFTNFTNTPILYTADNDVFGINIHDNNPQLTPLNQHPVRAYKPMTCSKLQTNIDISSAIFTSIPLNSSIIYDNVSAFSTVVGKYRVRRKGVYKITANVITKSTANDYTIIECGVFLDSVSVVLLVDSLKFITNATYKTISMECIVLCNTSQTIEIKARNGELVHGGFFNCEWLRYA